MVPCNLLLLFKNHQDIFDTLETFKNAKHSPVLGPWTGADKQAFSALLSCGSAAPHYLCMSLNLPNPFLDTELWLQYFDLEPTGNASEKINACNNLEARIKNHFTGSDGTACMGNAKKNAQLIKDVTTNNPSLRKMINVKVAAREAVVSNYGSLKVFVISMTEKKNLGGVSEKMRRISDSTSQYGGALQFNNSSQFVQQTSAWSLPPPSSAWSLSQLQFNNDHVFAAIVDDGLCSYLQIHMIDESEAYIHTGEWILAAISATSCALAVADAKDCTLVCTNSHTGGDLLPHPLCGQPQNSPFCDKPCRICKHPPDSHAEHCI